MPKTNYRDCWWLIRAMTGEFDAGSYKGGCGYSLRNLNDLLPMHERVKYDWFSLSEPAKKERDNFRHDIMRRRAIIYNEFGLAILSESDPGKERGKGEGGYYYYLANPELLDGETKTLRSLIEFLANSETERDSWVKVGDIDDDYRNRVPSSLGFISAGGTSSYGFLSGVGTTPREILGEEDLVLIQFAMEFGEVLTIKYGKVKTGVDINDLYSFEPYQLKEIGDRWYVIGNGYPLGHKEKGEVVIYDLARLQLADEDNPDQIYEPVKGFDIDEHIHLDSSCKRRIGGVRAFDIITNTEEFADYISKHPLCSAQEPIKEGFRIFSNLTTDLIVQLGAYGDELTIGLPEKEGEDEGERYLIHHILNYFRKASSKTREE